MPAVRFSDAVDMVPFAKRATADLEYCRRVGAYLGLSLETVISTMIATPKKARSKGTGELGAFGTARPRRAEPAPIACTEFRAR